MNQAKKLSSSAKSSRTIIAVFDFDGTLTSKDSFLPFLQWAHGRFYWLALLPHSLILVGYLLNLVSNHRVKEVLLSKFFAGWLESELQSVATEYAIHEIPKFLNPLAIERLRWHQKQGHKILIVSANLEIYLQIWAKQMGVDNVLATQLVFENSLFLGKIKNRCCYGQEKVKRLQEYLDSFDNYCLHIYGDSKGDREMLAIADYSYYRIFNQAQSLFIK